MEVSIVIGATPIAGFLEHPKMKCGWELEVPPFRNLPLYHQGCSIYWRLGCTPYMSLSPYVEKKTVHPMVQKIMLRIKFQIWTNYIYADASDHHVWTRLCYIRIHMIVYVHVSGT
jgi:hypothetical protein